MKFFATIELKSLDGCDECPLARDNESGMTLCRLGGFYLPIERSEKPNSNGFYRWYTPRPSGCPLVPVQDKTNQLTREYFENLKPGQRMIPKSGENNEG